DMIINQVQKALKPSEIIKSEVFGLDLGPRINKRTKDLEGESKSIQKIILRDIEKMKVNDSDIKVILDFDTQLKKIVYCNGFYYINEYGAKMLRKSVWMAVLNFPIATPFIFGRVTRKLKPGGGTFFFARFDRIMPGIIDILGDFKKDNGSIDVGTLIGLDTVLKIFSNANNLDALREEMTNALWLIEKKELTNIEFIDKLNQDKKLISILKKNPHYGTITLKQGSVITKFKSYIDITMIAFPYENSTIIHVLESGEKDTSKAVEALHYLINYLTNS
ncbi:MAG: hypothetical protein ACFFC3_04345, partial [Candidatus Odinarchaeota archaeon]